MRSNFTEQVVELIKSIPPGKVATYGQIAGLAGNRMGARQVVRIITSCWESDQLPWWRMINSRGTISLSGEGYELQRSMLEAEGLEFDSQGRIDLERFLFTPE